MNHNQWIPNSSALPWFENTEINNEGLSSSRSGFFGSESRGLSAPRDPGSVHSSPRGPRKLLQAGRGRSVSTEWSSKSLIRCGYPMHWLWTSFNSTLFTTPYYTTSSYIQYMSETPVTNFNQMLRKEKPGSILHNRQHSSLVNRKVCTSLKVSVRTLQGLDSGLFHEFTPESALHLSHEEWVNERPMHLIWAFVWLRAKMSEVCAMTTSLCTSSVG